MGEEVSLSESDTESGHNPHDPLPYLQHDSENSQESDFDDEVIGNTNRQLTTDVIQRRFKLKQRRLRPYYNDDYLQLFKDTYQDRDQPLKGQTNSIHLPDSTIGVAHWSGSEKAGFFTNLARYGIVNNIKPSYCSKQPEDALRSSIELQQYQSLLREASDDQQRYRTGSSHISYAEIPAAVEIGAGCESSLEKAADALCVFQDHYDFVLGERSSNGYWLIDRELATRLDEQNEKLEEANETDKINADDNFRSEAMQLFHLLVMLDLSEKLFMNMPNTSLHNHWERLAEQNERPSFTQDVLVEFYNLVVNFTRKITQTAIFLAKSRIRSMTTKHTMPAKVLSKEDVEAALDILNLSGDSWDYWKSYPRRSGLRIISGKHDQGRSSRIELTLEQAESELAVEGRRSRSDYISSLSNTDRLMSREGDDISQTSSQNGDDSAMDPAHSKINESKSDSQTESKNNQSEHAVIDVENYSVNVVQSREDSDGSLSAASLEGSNNRKRSHFDLEDEEDKYVEMLDQNARKIEEARLSRILDQVTDDMNEDEQDSLPPQKFRKMRRDLIHWTDGLDYMSSWERKQIMTENGKPSTND